MHTHTHTHTHHRCEWAADYHSGEPHVLDFNQLPGLKQRTAFVDAYLRTLISALGLKIATEPAAGEATGGPSCATSTSCSGTSGGGGGSGGADVWSTASSRGGSVASMPVDLEPPSSSSGGGGSSSTAPSVPPPPGAEELRSVWRWLDLHQPDRALLSQRRVLDACCFARLAHSLRTAAEAYTAASNLLWALWGVIQAHNSHVAFDYEGYAAQRWVQYLVTRPVGLPTLQ